MIGARMLGAGPSIDSLSPVDGKRIASVTSATADDYSHVMEPQRRVRGMAQVDRATTR